MKIVFLCAGFGTRLYPLTKDKPKALLSIGGEPLLNHLLKRLEPIASATDVTLVSNALFYEPFLAWAKTLKSRFQIRVINDGAMDNDRRLGAIRDLKLGLEGNTSQEDVLVLASDNLIDSNLSDFVAFAESKKAPCVGVWDVKDLELAQKYGLVKADSSGQVTQFLEKPKNPPVTLASMGIYFFPKESLKYIDQYLKENQNPDAPGFYLSWLFEKTPIYAYPFPGTWFDIGDINSYHKADQFFSNRKDR